MTNIDIGIDLGTANTVIYIRDAGIVVNQPSVVAYENNAGRKLIAVGNKAKRMYGRTAEDIGVCYPIEKGVISELTLAERMLKVYVKGAVAKRRIWGKPTVCVCVPSKATEVQKRAVEDAVLRTGAKKVYLLEEPFAAAVGLGIDISSAFGYMIVDIGAGTTDIAVVSKGGIEASASVKAAGDAYNEAIIKYVRNRHNILMGPTSAEALKHEIGAVYKREMDATGFAKGKELVRGLPTKTKISSSEIIEATKEVSEQILDAIRSVMEATKPELVADISSFGILLVGGGSKIYGMDKLIADRIGVRVKTTENAELLVAAGAGKAGAYVREDDEEEPGGI